MNIQAKQRLQATTTSPVTAAVDSDDVAAEFSKFVQVSEHFEDSGDVYVLFNSKKHVHGEDHLDAKTLTALLKAYPNMMLGFNPHANNFEAVVK